VKDPDTRKRVARINSAEAWITTEKYLFSGLTQCASCGGGFVLSSHDLLTCFNARSRSTALCRRPAAAAAAYERTMSQRQGWSLHTGPGECRG